MVSLRSVRRLHTLREEDGVALVLAMVVMLLFTTLTATAITMSVSSNGTAQSSNAAQTAYELAQAGVNRAEAMMNASGVNASSPTLLGCTANGSASTTPCTPITGTASGGSYSFSGMYSGGTWTISSTGAVANPNGGGVANVTRNVTATVTVTGGGQGNNISVWNYLYSTAPQGTGCEVDISGNNVVVDVPVYVTGDLCISGQNAAINENTANGGQKVDVRVQGKVVISGNNAHIGSATTPITSGYAGQGCTSTIGGATHTCTTADHWYVSTTDSPLTATPPTTNYPGMYTSASPGPNHQCDSTLTPAPNLATSQPHAFDSDTTMNGTNATFNLTPASDYNCVTSNGTLSWNHTTHILTVNGTVFFDGNLTTTDASAMYHGVATFYVNGEFLLNGNDASLRAGCPSSPAAPTHQCAFGNTSSEWDPNKDLILVVTDKANGTSIDMTGQNVQFQGGLMCTPTSTADMSGNNVVVEGGIICGKYSWGNNPVVYPLPTITNLPPNAPVPPNATASISPPTYSN